MYGSKLSRSKYLFTVAVPSWCEPATLKFQFPADLVESKKLCARVVSTRPPAADWITFDYVFFHKQVIGFT